MDWKLSFGSVGLIALILTGGLVWYNIQNAPREVPPSISFSEPAVINPYPELEGVHIKINRATVEELQQLPGIGETKAQAIYDYVQACGGIKSFRQLLDVEGIGEKTLRNIQPYLTISPPDKKGQP